ncbi:pyridoxal phosphate-dependent decarboxylase family protein [Amycolatopsis jejuensis]|uniref:pyridoxal phosphate-dependent decarboxylase family protein n=1 Tax=Amycolatopsis jejuensis TaxID=330084 RepID=UPI00068FFF14|nr:aspartate aminotransferase family protein [Amycolatopsis jejuensis]
MRPLDEVVNKWRRIASGDVDWRNGRTTRYIYFADDELEEIARQAYGEFMSHNALSATAFPSVAEFEAQLLRFAGRLLGNAEAVGSVSSGGTESIILAVKTARDWARKTRAIENGSIVLPYSAHPAFDKAAHLLGLRAERVPLTAGFRADVASMTDAVKDDCILVVGSAMCWPFGTIDPIVELGRLALDADVPLHVDACAGGFLLPFVDELSECRWGLEVPGVASISADLHKYGYAGKGVSTILYNDVEYASFQPFSLPSSGWPGGAYRTPTLAGTRPGGPIASAWAVVEALEHDGFRALAAKTMAASRAWQRGIGEIGGLEILGQPPGSIFAYRATGLDTMAVGDELQARGWQVGRQQAPRSIQIAVNPPHLAVTDDYLRDLAESVAAVRSSGAVSSTSATYA